MGAFLALLLVAALLGACSPPGGEPPAEPPATAPAPTPFDAELAAPHCYGEGAPLFEDATATAGVGHIFRSPDHSEAHVRSLGGGAAMEDLDGDGDLDLYVSNAGGPNALYLNRGDGTFLDHAAERGVGFPEDQTLGVSAADYDNDGDQDLLLLNRGGNRLLRNDGGALFVDVTQEAGLSQPVSAASAAWSDLDLDGDLDVVIAVVAPRYDRTREPSLSAPHVYLNQGDGTFQGGPFLGEDQALPRGSTYVALAHDLDDDGRPEVLLPQEFGYLVQTRLYANHGEPGAPLSFTDVSTDALLDPQAPMGGALVDPDGDGDPDVFLTNLAMVPPFREVLWENQGSLSFAGRSSWGAHAMDAQLTSELARAVSWGAVAFDRENDGDEDLYVVYGAFQEGDDIPWVIDYAQDREFVVRQPNALLELTDGQYGLREGTCAEEMGLGRGVVAGDVNGDGCLDLYVVNQEGPARLLNNRCEGAGRALVLRLIGTADNRDAVGARVEVRAGGRTQAKWVLGGSLVLYGSNPKRLSFGLGAEVGADEVRVRWPGGQQQVVYGLSAGEHELLQPEP